LGDFSLVAVEDEDEESSFDFEGNGKLAFKFNMGL
jgi:hypothetical protein